MAQLLETRKYASARIRVENIIRTDLLTELHEILELYCELLLARSGLLENTPLPGTKSTSKDTVVPLEELDPGIYEAIVVIVHAAPRTEIRELHTVRGVLVERYGRGFMEEAGKDEKGVVPERVKRKLKVEPPGPELVESYLKAIAGAYDVAYGSDGEDDGGSGEKEEEVAADGPKGHDQEDSDEGKGKLEEPLSTHALKDATPSPPRQPAGAKSPVSIAPPNPRTDNANPKVKMPPGPPELKPNDKMKKAAATDTKGGPGGKVPDVDDLEARFKMLKR